ncbi:MAG: GreA/GreB family elongation factor, partial [Candidatus Omnitrophica bacterium]|nr:GreA/GreB family elongation factor [Candidatus Omnitrophota bacterium]
LVTEDEADFSEGKISISSPVGKAILGKKKGEIVNIKIPAGTLKYKIVDICR